MTTIYALSKAAFDKMYAQMPKIQKVQSAFISINDGFDYNWDSSPNFLNLTFDDVEMDYQINSENLINPILFTVDHAKQIKEFVDANADKHYLYVHCTMGKCRSGAVAECINDYFGNNYQRFKQLNPQILPNTHVKLTLNKTLTETC